MKIKLNAGQADKLLALSNVVTRKDGGWELPCGTLRHLHSGTGNMHAASDLCFDLDVVDEAALVMILLIG